MVSNEMLTFIVVGVTFAGLAVIALITWAYYRYVDRVACSRNTADAAERRVARPEHGLGEAI